jgi:hypothetical protein
MQDERLSGAEKKREAQVHIKEIKQIVKEMKKVKGAYKGYKEKKGAK